MAKKWKRKNSDYLVSAGFLLLFCGILINLLFRHIVWLQIVCIVLILISVVIMSIVVRNAKS